MLCENYRDEVPTFPLDLTLGGGETERPGDLLGRKGRRPQSIGAISAHLI